MLFDVWSLANSTRAVLGEALVSSGLTADEFALYSLLCAPEGRTPGEVAAMLCLPATTVSSIVRRLEQRGHLHREPSLSDRRSYRIALTADGRATHQRAGAIFLDVLHRVEQHLDRPVEDARRCLRSIDDAVRAAALPASAAPINSAQPEREPPPRQPRSRRR